MQQINSRGAVVAASQRSARRIRSRIAAPLPSERMQWLPVLAAVYVEEVLFLAIEGVAVDRVPATAGRVVAEEEVSDVLPTPGESLFPPGAAGRWWQEREWASVVE